MISIQCTVNNKNEKCTKERKKETERYIMARGIRVYCLLCDVREHTSI